MNCLFQTFSCVVIWLSRRRTAAIYFSPKPPKLLPKKPTPNTRLTEAKITAENECLKEELSKAHEPKPSTGELAKEGVSLSKRKLKEVGKAGKAPKDGQKYGNPLCFLMHI